MRLLLKLTSAAAVVMAVSSASAEQLRQTHDRYMACNERAVQAAAQEPYPAYMLNPTILASCRTEEEALKAQLPSLVVEEMHDMLRPWNEQAIERIRRQHREGIMQIAPRSAIER